jgi:FHA domain
MIYHPAEGSCVFELFSDRAVSIGPAKWSSRVLDNVSISRLHAVIRSTPDGQRQILDRVSSNGVPVNGVLTKEFFLRANGEIIIGEYRTRFFEDSTSREMVTYGSSELPPRLVKGMSEPTYSGSLIQVQSLSNPASPGFDRLSNAEERLQALERENRLLTLLYRVNRALSEDRTVGEVAQRVLHLVLAMEGAERGPRILRRRSFS